MRPLQNEEEIQERLDAVAAFTESEQVSYIEDLHSHLKGISDLRTIVLRIKYVWYSFVLVSYLQLLLQKSKRLS